MNNKIFMARANFYAFLSRMFVEEPPFELAKDIADGKLIFPKTSSLNKDIAEGLSLFAGYAQSNRNGSDIHEKMCREYTRLFIGPVPAMFPYESRYMDGSIMGKSLTKVKENYRKAGLKISQEYHEPEDHIAVELGFMGHLCMQKSDGSLMMQKEFLNDHLLKWAPVFCDELFEKSGNEIYRGIGKITKGFLASEKDVLNEKEMNENHLHK